MRYSKDAERYPLVHPQHQDAVPLAIVVWISAAIFVIVGLATLAVYGG